MHCLDGSSHGFSHGVFDLREELFDRVEIRTVGRQEEEPCACGPNHLPDGLALMRAQVVEHDDIARLKGREKLLFDIGPEGVAVDGAVDHPWRIDPNRSSFIGDLLLHFTRPYRTRRAVHRSSLRPRLAVCFLLVQAVVYC